MSWEANVKIWKSGAGSGLGRAWGLALASATVGAPALAQDIFPADLPSACTLENVAGAFGFNHELLSTASTGEPAASMGILDLRPDGTFALQFRGFVEVGGEVVTSPVYGGEWEVEENCVGFADFEEAASNFGPVIDIDFQFVAVENASELFLIRNEPLEEADAKLLLRR